MNTRFRSLSRTALWVALLIAVLALPLAAFAANTVVTPANPNGWAPTDVRTDATVGITADNPRNGLGSLKFTTNTVTSGQDKADFTKTWTSATRTLGSLSDVSFEFYRASSSTTAAHFAPVLRLLWWQDNAPAGPGVEDHTGYLVWEQTYNGYGSITTNAWQTDNLFADFFWMRLVSGPNSASCNKTIQNFNVTLAQWKTTVPSGQPGDCTPPDFTTSSPVYIYGVNTGVGSGWGNTFLGYVDNVVVAFGADVESANFEPNPLCTTVCYADAVNGNDADDGMTPATAFKTIQKAIDTVQAGGQVRVLPGNYDETALNRDVLGAGSYQFGLFFEETAKDGVSVRGVTAADVVITDPNATQAFITTNATNNFGTSGIFVEADDVTISGVEIGPNTPGENKTIEIIGDNFTLKDCLMTGDGVDGAYPYFDDWRYDDNTNTAHLQSYTVTNNVFGAGSQVSFNSGAGASGPVSGRQITDNVFTMNAGQNWPSIAFNGDGTTVPWFTYPVGGAVITGNDFTNNAVGGQHIRVRGVSNDSEFDWASYWNDNTYNKAVVAGVNPPNDVRAWSYSTSYTFNDVRVIGADIQPEIDHAQPGDTVLVNEGTYPESPEIDKDLTLVSDDGRDVTFIELQTGVNYVHSLRFVDGSATVDGFTIVGRDAACPTLASSNLYVENAADNIVIKNNRVQVGQIGGCSTGDDGFGVVTAYNETTDVPSVVVENNIFEPLNASGRRVFYINPGVDVFKFVGNTITGDFTASAVTQAKDGLVENNTLTGTGTSRGFSTWGYPDPTVYGATVFQGNIISDVVNGISILGSENVTVRKNIFTGNDRAVYVALDAPFNLSTIHINRNSIAGNTMGIENDYETEVDGTCNWWGDASGPGPVGPGSGDPVSTFVDFTPWLYSSNLDGPCYVGGTISIDKVAANGGATQFTFDVSWSATNVTLTDAAAPYVTNPPLQAGNYNIAEINLPSGWSLQTATCDNTTTTPIETVNPSSITVADGDAWVCTFTNVYTPPPSNICPTSAASSQYTDLLGIGMGSPKKHKGSAKINLPNSANLVDLYGQLVAKDNGQAKYVRFIMAGKNNYVQVNTITGPLDHQYGKFWYGADLSWTNTPPKYVIGKWFLQKSGTKGHIPRAFVLYATYQNPTNTYVNIWDTFTASEGEVYWDTAQGWTPTRQIVMPIAAPLGPTTFHVELAVAGNDKDTRPVWVTVTAGNVTQTQKPTNPSNGDQLNLMTFTLTNVPAGTNQIVITVYSPSPSIDGVNGESAALVGMAANYQCAPLSD